VSPLIVVKAHLEHLAIITWPVEAERLATMLPVPLVPQTIDRKRRVGLVSMALMRDTTAGSTYAQLNERAYVMLPDGRGKGAYFWRSHAATWQAVLVRGLLGAPEYVADVELAVKDGTFVFKQDRQVVAKLDLRRRGTTPEVYRGYDVERAERVSSNPMLAYTMNWGRLCVTPVRHNRIRPRRVSVVRADAMSMLPGAVIEPERMRKPLLAVYQRQTPFWIDLPPRPIAGGGYGLRWLLTGLAGAR